MIPDNVTSFLSARDVSYRLLTHPPSVSSMRTARAAHIPGDRLAKAIVLEDDREYVMAIIPATHHLDTIALAKRLQRVLHLAPEDDFALVFRDCQRGAVPPLGPAYGMRTIVDDAVLGLPEVYLECGDHEHLLRISGDGFARLYTGAEHGRISHHA